MTIASADFNLQRKHHLICHVAKVKPVASAHSMADVIPFLVYSICPPGGGGGSPMYGLYRYVPRDRVCFLRFLVLK